MLTHSPRVPQAVREQIFACEMEEGWDLESAKAVTVEACQSALQFLETVLAGNSHLPMPQVSASAVGAVTLEWSQGSRHVAIRVFDCGPTFYMSEEPGGIRSRGYEDRQNSVLRILDFFPCHAQQS